MSKEVVFEIRLGMAGDFYVVLTAFYDWHSNPADWDSSDEAYLEAYRRGDISFLTLKVSCRYFGTELGESWLGGVEYGSYGDWVAGEDEIAKYVIDENSWMIDEAVSEAEQELNILRGKTISSFEAKFAPSLEEFLNA
jgi:hypothetical protein